LPVPVLEAFPIIIRDAPDTVLPHIRPAGYPANPKAGYRISGRISGKDRIPVSGRILDLTTIFLVKYQVNFLKAASTITDFIANIKQSMI
jgi:hypothetical protein